MEKPLYIPPQDDQHALAEMAEAEVIEVSSKVQEREIRNQLYWALKDTRGEPGLSIEKVAGQIMTAWAREEVEALIRELNKNLDA